MPRGFKQTPSTFAVALLRGRHSLKGRHSLRGRRDRLARSSAVIAALSEVEQFHQIDVALQLKQFLHETRELLTRMIRVVNVRAACDETRVTKPVSPI